MERMIRKYNRKFSEIPPEMIRKLLNLPEEESIKLFERIKKRIHLEKDKILEQAFDENILTKEEYEQKYKDMFYDDHGMDSFVQYIDAVLSKKVDCFVTFNERMLNKKEELKERFGLRIASPKEILEEHGRKNK